MKEIHQRSFPWWGIPLVALASIRFERNGEGHSMHYDGAALGVLILGIILVVLLFGILSRWQDYLLARRKIKRTVRSRYWPLLGFVIIFGMIEYRAASDRFFEKVGSNEMTFRWDFQLGALDQQIWFIAAFIAFLFLHTIKLIIEELAATALKSGQDAGGDV